MDFEQEIKNRLLMRGFPNDKLLNNRGLIGATIDEVILLTVKNLAIHNVSQQSELVCRSYYPNNMSTGMECLNCGKGKHEH